jgi:acyl carrier protein
LSFIAIDISPRGTADLLSAWRAVGEHFNAGKFTALPLTVFPIDEVNKAFEYMASAAHIGKVVVSLDDKEALKRFVVRSEETAGSSASQQWRSAAAGQSRVQPGPAEVSAATSSRRGMVEPDAALSPAEGAQAFSLILNNAESRILVTPRDFLNTNFEKPQFADSPVEAGGYRPSHPRPGLNNEYVAPRDETERAIAEIWQHLLGIEQVGINDDFFELGGDSLLATQVISRMRDTLKVDIAVGKMFEDATVSGLAALVEPARWSAQKQQTRSREIEGDRDEGIL